MDNQEGFEFIRSYFNELFGERDINALDRFLDQSYFDDDIGDPSVDHIQNSKEYLKNLLQREPTIGVEVKEVIVHDNVITAYLEWTRMDAGHRQYFRKGVGIFVVKNKRIVKRHTFIYETIE